MATSSRPATTATKDQHSRIPPTYLPRRSPVAGLPRIAEADRPNSAELARLRKRPDPMRAEPCGDHSTTEGENHG